jgi:hypothetical protein
VFGITIGVSGAYKVTKEPTLLLLFEHRTVSYRAAARTPLFGKPTKLNRSNPGKRPRNKIGGIK